MLARNFKTADELKIETKLHNALIKVLDMMERDELHQHRLRPDMIDWDLNGRYFNMAVSRVDLHCGTVACIAGWASKFMNEDATTVLVEPTICSQLFALFYPPRDELSSITVDQAACALRNYLTLGRPEWEQILGAK